MLVEGWDDLKFFEALLTHEMLSGFQIQNFKGKDKLPAFLATLPKVSGFDRVKSIGIVRDADGDPEAAFASVCSALQRGGLDIPHGLEAPTGGNPSIGVILLPGSGAAGTLEHLLLKAVSTDDAMECVDAYLKCIQEKDKRPDPIQKAAARVFLASRADPDLQLGDAAKRGYWNLNNSAYDDVKRFLHSL